MSDPYYEATRGTGRGMPLWARLLVTFGGLSAIALVVLLLVGVRAANELRGRLDSELTGSPAEVFADMTRNVLGDDVTIVTEDQPEGQVALRLGEDGQEVPVDLSDFGDFVEEGLALIQEGVDKGVRFEGRADESGVSVTVRGPSGMTLFELKGDEDGGYMRVAGEDREMFLGLGDEAARAPGWLPVYRRARVRKQLFSYDSGHARSGGLILVADDDPERIHEWYAEQLRDGDSPVRPRVSRTATVFDRYRARIEADDGRREGNRVQILVSREADAEETTIMVVYREVRETR